MKISSKEELYRALREGESSALEFRAKIPDPKSLAILICAFQNTEGGHIVIGVTETGDFAGVDQNAALNVYGRARKLIAPYDISTFETLEIDGKSIVIIAVNASMTRIVGLTVDGISYQRTGSAVVPISADTIVNKIRSVLPNNDIELPHIADLALKIEELNKRLIESESWKSKAMDMIIGGIVGALISAVFGWLVG
jgi:hypothetical protein